MPSPSGIDMGTPPKATRLRRGIIVVVLAALTVAMIVIVRGIYGNDVAAQDKEPGRTYGPANATAQEVLSHGAGGRKLEASVVPIPTPPVNPQPAVPQPVPMQYAYATMPQPQISTPVETPEEKAAKSAMETEQKAMAAPASPQGWRMPGGSSREPVAQQARSDQDDKEAFLERKEPKPDLLAVRVPPKTPYAILWGWWIPAILESMTSSDLPGGIKARVRENVFDSATGRYLLIPQGSTLVGIYSSHVSFGQNAAQQVWDRINFPDGSEMDLGGMEGHDAQGRSGLRDKVDNHYKRILGTAFLTSAFFAVGIAAQSRRGNALTIPSPGETVGTAAATQMSEQGTEITRRNLNIQPTIEIRPGDRFDVFVNRDMLFGEPYRAMTTRH